MTPKRIEWYRTISTSDHILTFDEWYHYLELMTDAQEPEIRQMYNPYYPEDMLSLLQFKNESQIIQLIEQSEDIHAKLLVPQTAFGNLSCLSLYCTNHLILRSIMSLRSTGYVTPIKFYKQSKINTDLDLILLW